jgi:hypothetical protein
MHMVCSLRPEEPEQQLSAFTGASENLKQEQHDVY